MRERRDARPCQITKRKRSKRPKQLASRFVSFADSGRSGFRFALAFPKSVYLETPYLVTPGKRVPLQLPGSNFFLLSYPYIRALNVQKAYYGRTSRPTHSTSSLLNLYIVLLPSLSR